MKTIIKKVEIKYHYVTDFTVFIDFFFVPVHLQGSRLGKKVFKHFIKSLPYEVTEIRLVAAKSSKGRVIDFWQKQGFSFLYDIKNEDFDDDILYTMTKAINGGTTRKFIFSESFENEYDYF